MSVECHDLEPVLHRGSGDPHVVRRDGRALGAQKMKNVGIPLTCLSINQSKASAWGSEKTVQFLPILKLPRSPAESAVEFSEDHRSEMEFLGMLDE